MNTFTFDVNSLWFAILVFGLYSVYQFVFYEFFRYYPFTITLLFMAAILIFAPFLILPSYDTYRIFLYFAVSFFFLYASTVRIIYFNNDHSHINKTRFHKALHHFSTKLFANWHSQQIDYDETQMHFYNKLTAIIIYCSLFLHIVMFIMIDLVSITNAGNIICGVLLCISIPIPSPNSFLSPTLHTSYISSKRFELLVPLSPGWIVLYSLWILLFIASWASCIECHLHVIILVVIPLIRSFYKKRYHLWYTSFLFGIAAMTVFTQPFYPYFLNSNEIYYVQYIVSSLDLYHSVLNIWGLVNALYAIAYCLFYARRIYNHWVTQQEQLRRQSQPPVSATKPAENANNANNTTATQAIVPKEAQAMLDQTAKAYKLHAPPLNTKNKVGSFSPSSGRMHQKPTDHVELQMDQQKAAPVNPPNNGFQNAHYAEY
eukprot:187117_1